MNAGCDAWYSAVGGLFPAPMMAIARAALQGDAEQALRLSARLEPLWALFRRHGSVRVIATAAELLGLAEHPCLPPPLLALQGQERQALAAMLPALQLA